jgi:hypothetical protein
MNSKIRLAAVEDAAAFLAIKNELPITRTDGTTTRGGFLLGTDLQTYRQYIEQAYCLVAEVEGEVVGFGIVFGDSMLRNSDVWTRRREAKWFVDIEKYEKKRLCYFEQLAFLPGHRKLVIALAYNLVKWVFELGHEVMLTTTVREPIVNLAAVPFIHAVSGIHAGNIDETYPTVGHINSDIYLVESENFFKYTEKHRLYPFLQKNSVILSL